MSDSRVCPKCGKKYDDYPAISREDNKTEICPNCGVEEAMVAYWELEVEKCTKRYQRN